MKVLATITALALAGWLLLTVLPALKTFFHLLAVGLIFFAAVAALVALTVAACLRAARWRRRRRASALGARPAATPASAEAHAAALPDTPAIPSRPPPVPASQPAPKSRSVPRPPMNDTGASSGTAEGGVADPTRASGPASSRDRQPPHQPPARPVATGRLAGRSGPFDAAAFPRGRAGSPPGSLRQPPISSGRPRGRHTRDHDPRQVIVIERCDGVQVGQGNDQYNVYRISLPDVTLVSDREWVEALFRSDASWARDVFSLDGMPSITNSGRIGSGASWDSVLAGSAGDTLVIVRNSRGVQVGDHNSQRNEFRIRVRAVPVRATGVGMNPTRRRSLEQLRKDPGNRAAARALADDIARAAADAIEVEVKARAIREVRDSRTDGLPRHVYGKTGRQFGSRNWQSVRFEVESVRRLHTERLQRAFREMAEPDTPWFDKPPRQSDPPSHGAARDENGDSIIERDPSSPWERGSGDLF